MKYFCIRCILPFNTCNNCEVEIIISYLYLRTLEIREINNLPVSTQQVSRLNFWMPGHCSFPIIQLTHGLMANVGSCPTWAHAQRGLRPNVDPDAEGKGRSLGKSLSSPDSSSIWVHISAKHQPQVMMPKFPAPKRKLTQGV